MKRKLKTVLLCIVCIGLLAGGCFGWYALKKAWYQTHTFPAPEKPEELETEPYVIDYIYDPDDLEKVTAAVDDIFVGRVEACLGTTYEDVKIHRGRWAGTPATHYRITNLGNIKGRLRTDVPLEAQTFGGVQIGGRTAMAPPGGFLTTGHYYILLMSANPDGGLCFDQKADLGAQIDRGELTAYFDTLQSEGNPALSENASSVLRLVDRYVQAYLHRDLSFERAERYPSEYEQE